MNRKKILVRRLIWLLIGNIMLSFATCLLRISDFGTDPFATMVFGMSNLLSLSYGTYQMLFNIVLFIPIFCVDRRSFGIGSLVNMFLLGYFIEAWMWFFGTYGITVENMHSSMPARIFCLIAGIVCVCIGIALYVDCDLGAGPYDRLAIVLENLSHGKLKFHWCRLAYDCIAILVGYLAGSTVGIATFFVGFFTGPLVGFFRTHLTSKLLSED